MQNQPAGRHAKLSEGACAAENSASLKCACLLLLNASPPRAALRRALTPNAPRPAPACLCAGIEANYTDRGKCAAFFSVYKVCKQKAYEAARAARIRAHSGGCGVDSSCVTLRAELTANAVCAATDRSASKACMPEGRAQHSFCVGGRRLASARRAWLLRYSA